MLPHRKGLGCPLRQRRPRAEPTRGAAERRLSRPGAVVLREHVLDRALGEAGGAHRRVVGAGRLLGPARVDEGRGAAAQRRGDVRRDGLLPRGRHLPEARLGAVDAPREVVLLLPLRVGVDVVQEDLPARCRKGRDNASRERGVHRGDVRGHRRRARRLRVGEAFGRVDVADGGQQHGRARRDCVEPLQDEADAVEDLADVPAKDRVLCVRPVPQIVGAAHQQHHVGLVRGGRLDDDVGQHFARPARVPFVAAAAVLPPDALKAVEVAPLLLQALEERPAVATEARDVATVVGGRRGVAERAALPLRDAVAQRHEAQRGRLLVRHCRRAVAQRHEAQRGRLLVRHCRRAAAGGEQQHRGCIGHFNF